MTPTWKNHLLRFLQGALIGTGAILPGISGGVLCVAFGIYESMMAFLSHPRSSFKSNYKILLPVIVGGAVGFILLAKVVESLLAASAVLAISLFCGLICGTVPDLMKKSAAAGAEKGWSFFIIALIASFTFFHILDSGMEGHISPNFGWYIFCGVIWGLSMIVPGLSSSSILLFMGLYQPMAEGIGNIDFGVLIPMMLGFIVTVAVCAKIMNRLIQQHYGVLSKFILGFVVSSVLMIVPTSFSGILQLILGILCFAIGFILARMMDVRRPEE